ncbi:MAG: rhombosortase [Rhizobiaceae bacterium]|jgi:membrane associated rhomboid family serine protease|nr:rhombosortase [Rhizobiaceae bacterium]
MTEPVPDVPPGGVQEPEKTATAREPVFNLPGVVLLLMSLCVAIHLLRLYLLDVDQDRLLLDYLAFIPSFYSSRMLIDVFSFTSPVSYSLLHGSLPHLAINMIWLAAFGSPLANRLGAARFVLFWVVTSMAAAALHFAVYPLDNAPLVGASGAISGMMGAAARFGFRMQSVSGKAAFGGSILPIAQVLRRRGVVTFLAVWMIVNLATGLLGMVPGEQSQIAWEAHIGGFVVGFFFVHWFDPRRPPASGRLPSP